MAAHKFRIMIFFMQVWQNDLALLWKGFSAACFTVAHISITNWVLCVHTAHFLRWRAFVQRCACCKYPSTCFPSKSMWKLMRRNKPGKVRSWKQEQGRKAEYIYIYMYEKLQHNLQCIHRQNITSEKPSQSLQGARECLLFDDSFISAFLEECLVVSVEQLLIQNTHLMSSRDPLKFSFPCFDIWSLFFHAFLKFRYFVWYTITSQEDIRILSNYTFLTRLFLPWCRSSKEDKQQSMSSLYPFASASI